jgi:probable rRNA maturation factor
MNAKRQDRNVAIQITENFKAAEVDLSALKKSVKSICRRFKLSKVSISIVLAGDAEIMRLNKKFLNRNRTTDCLSFDLSDNDGMGPKVFELVVNAKLATRQAKLRGHCCQAELMLYITHGLLHNLGFDDSTPPKARKMHDAEDEILKQEGFGKVFHSS